MTDINWECAPLPENESERLGELLAYHILDTHPEAVFDRLTLLAARHFGMPVALLSLVDRDRQWFKSHYGIDDRETPREVAFCAHAILRNDVMVVPDATADSRFSGNPLVCGKASVRFYAGAPLINSKGYKLGTLCVIDHLPRQDFTEAQKLELESFAAIAVDEMELRVSALTAKRDLYSVQAAQQAVEEAQRKSEILMQEKSQFLATMSHELRTPMNGILGMAYLLGDTPLNELQREYISTINHSAQNLLLLINDILDLSKIEARELVLERKPFDIKTSFMQTIKLLKPLASKKGNALVCTIDPLVPTSVIGDPGRFAQIVTNLVGNAVKFTDDGKVEASLYYEAANNQVRCTIDDTGIGIPEDKHDAIFEKYTQGDATIAEKFGGTGLGLAITKHLVVMLGGEIGFESQEKVGSHFWFTFPLTPPEENISVQSGPVVASDVSGLIAAKNARVLVAEDHPVNQLFLIAFLKKLGFSSIDVAENGLEVMEKLRTSAGDRWGSLYDAIFMDCKMPQQDGYETARLIRSIESRVDNHRPVPIIALTANALAGDREACIEAGMDEYLSKPLQPDLLKEVLRKWFSFTDDGERATKASVKLEPSVPPLDFARLQLVAETEPDKIALLNLFFRLSRETIAAMDGSRRGEEFERWRLAAHSLKGAAANLGMTALENLCRQSEKAGELTYGQRSALLQNIRDELMHIHLYIREQSPTMVILEE